MKQDWIFILAMLGAILIGMVGSFIFKDHPDPNTVLVALFFSFAGIAAVLMIYTSRGGKE